MMSQSRLHFLAAPDKSPLCYQPHNHLPLLQSPATTFHWAALRKEQAIPLKAPALLPLSSLCCLPIDGLLPEGDFHCYLPAGRCPLHPSQSLIDRTEIGRASCRERL